MIDLLGRRRTARAALVLILAAVALAARAQGALAQSASALPLEIDRAQELARRGSDEVRARQAAAEAALRAVDAARANFFPKLSGSVSGAYLANPPVGKGITANTIPIYLYNPSTGWAAIDPVTHKPAVVAFPPVDITLYPDAKDSFFKGNLTFTQPIFAWGKIKAAVDLASLEAEVAGIGGRGAELDAARSANRAYFSALLSREGSAILQELRNLAASILEDRKSAMDEGFATKEQILSSEADLAALETRLVQAREGEASAMEALGLLTGLDPQAIALVSAFRETLPPFSEAELKDSSIGASTEAEQAAARFAQARKKLDLERGSSLFLPDVSFFASLDASGQDIPFTADSWKETWSWDLSLGIAAKADFFDGGASAARKREAAADLEATGIAAGAAEKAARLQARRAVDAARGAEASLREKEARAAWASEVLRNVRAKAADQAASRPEVSASAIGEATARLDRLYARYALEEAIADLERIAGRLFAPKAAQ